MFIFLLMTCNYAQNYNCFKCFAYKKLGALPHKIKDPWDHHILIKNLIFNFWLVFEAVDLIKDSRSNPVLHCPTLSAFLHQIRQSLWNTFLQFISLDSLKRFGYIGLQFKAVNDFIKTELIVRSTWTTEAICALPSIS